MQWRPRLKSPGLGVSPAPRLRIAIALVGMSEPLSWRPPRTSDAPAVLGLIVTRDLADLGVVDYTLEDLRDEWAAGAGVDLDADAVVVEAGGTLVGFAIVRRSSSLIQVAPEYEGRGLDERLLRWAEDRERERGRALHRQEVPGGNERAQELMWAGGYCRARSYWRMARPLERMPESSRMPEGFEAGAPDVDSDARTLHELDAQSFAANADYEPESFDDFRAEHLRAHDLDPALSLLAESHGQPAAFLLARRWQGEGVGYVDLLAVQPRYRGRGVASAMLETAFVAFVKAGLTQAQLGVASDNADALRLYERVGMSPLFRIDRYERPVDR
jgi:mycothiol synthase